MDSEWLPIELETPLRQGDLLICRDPQSRNVTKICLVITADCDISNSKFGRNLLCLRVTSFEDYICSTWATKRLNDAKTAATQTVHDQLRKWHTNKLGNKSALTADGVIRWVKRTEPETICADLDIPEKESKKVKNNLSKFKTALIALDNEQHDPFRKLVNFRSVWDQKELQALKQEVIV
jgi:hypothetical protein